MKILFTADQHINTRKKGVPKEWAVNRFTSYFSELGKIEHDILILGGDFFDRAPSIQEVGLFINFVTHHPKPIFIIAGNHEATTKYSTFLPELDSFENVTFCLGQDDHIKYDDLVVYFMTYDKIKAGDTPPKVDATSRSLLISHARGQLPFVDPEYDFSKFQEFDLVLLGDLHSMHQEKSFKNVWYPGSPYSITFEQGNLEKEWGVFLVDTGLPTLLPEFIPLDLPKLVKVTCTPDDVKSTLAFTKSKTDCYLVEVTGSSAELIGIDKSVKRKVQVLSEATVNLINKSPSAEILTVLNYMKVPNIKQVMEVYCATT